MTNKEIQFERIYEKTKDFGRTHFVREIQRQINDNKKKDKKIKELQKKAELGDHYKHLYSLVKKQKDDVVEYIKNNTYFEDNYVSLQDYNKLQSNWNNLREWLEDLYNKGYDIKIVLDKMNELEGKDKE